MRTRFSQSTAGLLSLEHPQSINVVIVYEDYATGLRAKRLHDNLCRQLEPECEVNQSMWKFDVLSSPRLGAVAAEEATEADLILVSMHGDGELPREVKDWLETWAAEKTGQNSALVALFDEVEEDESQVDTIQRYLRQIARRGGMSFFADPAASPEWEAGFTPERTELDGADMAPVWVDAISYEPASRHWGINE